MLMTNTERCRQWYYANREKRCKYLRLRKEANPETYKMVQRRCDLKRRFGISTEQYTQMLLKQNGCCAICKRDAGIFKRKLSVDHNHTTGKVRELLCMKCNIQVGYIEKTAPVLDNITEYLRASA